MHCQYYENELYLAFNPCQSYFINQELIDKIWDEVKERKHALNKAVEIYSNKFNEKYLCGMYISRMIFQKEKFDDYDLINKLINNIIKESSIYNYKFEDTWTFTELIAENKKISLTNDQKDFLIDMSINHYRRFNRIRELMLRREDISEAIKMSIVGTYPQLENDNYYEGSYENLIWNIKGNIQEDLEELFNISVDRDLVYRISTKKLLELFPNQENDIRCIENKLQQLKNIIRYRSLLEKSDLGEEPSIEDRALRVFKEQICDTSKKCSVPKSNELLIKTDEIVGIRF